MDDAAFVRGFERVGDLTGDCQRIVQRQRSTGDQIRKRVTFDELEDDARRAGGLLESIDGGNVGMVERGKKLRLALESRLPIGIARDFLRKHLERDFALQRCIAGAVDLAHAAGAKGRDDFVQAQPITRVESHLVGKRRRLYASAGTPAVAESGELRRILVRLLRICRAC